MSEPTHVASLRISTLAHDAIRQAAEDRGTKPTKLMREIVTNWLVDNGYLPERLRKAVRVPTHRKKRIPKRVP